MFAGIAALFATTALLKFSAAAPEGATVRNQFDSRQRSQTPLEGEETDELRLREGTNISNVSGYFRFDGEGATYVAEDGMEFGGLPNLSLERVVGTLKGAEKASAVRWSVSGMVTEFGNRNYLLISSAVYKSSHAPATPQAVGE